MAPDSASNSFAITPSTLGAYANGFQPYATTTFTARRAHLTLRARILKMKWNTAAINLALMRKVMATEAHMPHKNKVKHRFVEFTKHGNNNATIQMPWRKDGKHCGTFF